MAESPLASAVSELITIRDWLRYGVSRFTAAGLAFGHGTSNAADEAAFLILSVLQLPIDQFDPWLDARLTTEERMAVAEIFERRITTRKPAPYLVSAAWIGAHKFYVDERVIVPRSYIGELLREDLARIAGMPERVDRILDLCTGSGCLAILAALAFADAEVVGADISRDALFVAQRNVTDYGLNERVQLVQSDLFAELGQEKFDLIISNPPYVREAAVAAFPPEYKAEPRIAHAGGADGLALVRRILSEAPRYLKPEGVLIVEVGMERDALEAEFPSLPFLWLDTAESEGEVLVLPAEALTERPAKPRRSSKKS